MHIPQEAIHAACRAWQAHMHPGRKYDPKLDKIGLMEDALEAAFPVLAAHTLNSFADDYERTHRNSDITIAGVVEEIRESADVHRRHGGCK